MIFFIGQASPNDHMYAQRFLTNRRRPSRRHVPVNLYAGIAEPYAWTFAAPPIAKAAQAQPLTHRYPLN